MGKIGSANLDSTIHQSIKKYVDQQEPSLPTPKLQVWFLYQFISDTSFRSFFQYRFGITLFWSRGVFGTMCTVSLVQGSCFVSMLFAFLLWHNVHKSASLLLLLLLSLRSALTQHLS